MPRSSAMSAVISGTGSGHVRALMAAWSMATVSTGRGVRVVADTDTHRSGRRWSSSLTRVPLPAPDGPIYLVMRLYWPGTEPPSILPPGAGSWQPPAIVPAQ